LKKRSFLKKKLLKIILTIVNEGSSLTIVNEGLSLTIVNETTNVIKTVVFGKTIICEKNTWRFIECFTWSLKFLRNYSMKSTHALQDSFLSSLTIVNEGTLLTIVIEGSSLTIANEESSLTIVNEPNLRLSLTIVNEWSSLTIVNGTTIFIKTIVLKTTNFKKRTYEKRSRFVFDFSSSFS